MHGRPCYEVTFSTGEVIVAAGQHQWLTWDRPALGQHAGSEGEGPGTSSAAGTGTVLTTEQIAATVDRRSGDCRRSPAGPACGSFDLPEADLPMLPYTLG